MTAASTSSGTAPFLLTNGHNNVETGRAPTLQGNILHAYRCIYSKLTIVIIIITAAGIKAKLMP